MSCVTCEPKSTMRILSWDAMAGSKAAPLACRALIASGRLSAPQQADEKAVGLGTPRRHQQTFFGHKHRAGKKIGALAQDLHDIGGLFDRNPPWRATKA